eukprot:5800-Heterococcus_DN1.PRE.2
MGASEQSTVARTPTSAVQPHVLAQSFGVGGCVARISSQACLSRTASCRYSDSRRHQSSSSSSRSSGITMNISKKGVAQAQEFASAMNRVKDLVEDIPALLDDPSLVEVYTIAAAADARKAQNIKALRVSQLTVVTNFM